MKLTVLSLAFLCAAAAISSAAFSAPASERDAQTAFVRSYVAALQSKDVAGTLGLMHPANRACMNASNRAFFDQIVEQQITGFPKGRYSNLTIARVAPKSEPTLWAFLPSASFPYPVKPTYRIQIDFNNTPDSLFSDDVEVAQSGSSWYWVTACPNADGMRLFRQIQAKAARQKARAHKLASEIHEPLRSKIKALLANHDTFGAIKAYQKATGADFTTAATVIEAMQDPNR